MNLIPTLLNKKEAETIKEAFIELMKAYNSPAFGSITKRDFEIELFLQLQKLGLIEKNPSLYEVVSKLKITRTRAKNLIYEANLWNKSTEDLNMELKEVLSQPSFLNDGRHISIDVENPLLQDHIKSILKTLKHITDGSFSSDILKLTPEGYIALYLDVFGIKDENLKVATDYFKENGLMSDLSPKAILVGLIKHTGQKYFGEIGGQVAENVMKSTMRFLKSLTTESSIKESQELENLLF